MYPKVQKKMPADPRATDQPLAPPSGNVSSCAFSDSGMVMSSGETFVRVPRSFCSSSEAVLDMIVKREAQKFKQLLTIFLLEFSSIEQRQRWI